jgi:hypothetical protein
MVDPERVVKELLELFEAAQAKADTPVKARHRLVRRIVNDPR